MSNKSDENVDSQNTSGEGEVSRRLPNANCDRFLVSLVELVDSTEVGFGITLNCGGLTLTGQLISGKKYFYEFAETVAGAFPGDQETKDSIQSSFEQPAKKYDSNNVAQIEFIHLKDAKIIFGVGKMTGNLNLWRGKLSDVTGFSLGKLS